MANEPLTAGFHAISADQYHADPCVSPSLSSGVLSTIISGTLAEARWKHPRLNPAYEAEDSTKFDLGSVAHTLLLGKGEEIVPVDADDWRTKAAKDERLIALAQGKQPVLAKVLADAGAMVAAAREQLADDPDNRDAFNPAFGQPEVVAIAEMPTASGPVWCRAMMDWVQNVTDTGTGPIIYDYKTFAPGADPANFVRYLFRESRDVQDPFYSLVLGRLLALNPREIAFRFVVQSPKPPFLLSVIELDEQAREFAFERARWGMLQWAEAMKTGSFGGYLPRTHYVAPPTFELHRWSEKMMAGEQAAQLDGRAVALAETEEEE